MPAGRPRRPFADGPTTFDEGTTHMRRTLAASLVALSWAWPSPPPRPSSRRQRRRERPRSRPLRPHRRAEVDRQRARHRRARAGEGPVLRQVAPGRSREGVPTGQRARDATLVLRDLFSALDDLSPGAAQGGRRHPGPADRRPAGPLQRRLLRAVGEEVPGPLLHPLGDLAPRTRRRARPGSTRCCDLMNKVWKKEVDELGYRRPRLRPRPRRQQQVRRLPRADRRQRPLRLLRPRAHASPASSGWPPATACSTTTSPLEFPLAPIDSAPGHRRPRVLPRHPVRLRLRRGRLAARGHRHLDGGAGLRRRQRQPPVPPRRPDRRLAGPARLLQLDRQPAVRQLGLLRVPEQELRQRHRQADLEQGRRLRRAPTCTPPRRSATCSSPRAGSRRSTAASPSANLLPCEVLPRGPGLAVAPSWPTRSTRSPRPARTGKHGTHLLHMTSSSWLVKSSSSLTQQEVVPQGQDRRTGVVPDAGGVRPGAPRRKGLDKHFVRLNGKGNGRWSSRSAAAKVKAVYVSPGQRLDAVQVRQELRLLVPRPAHRRRPELPGPALQVQRQGHRARLSRASCATSALDVAAHRHRDGGGGLGRPAGARRRQGWLGPDVGRGDVFCEVPHDIAGVFQPANSLSNLGFVVAGLAVAWRAGGPGYSATCSPGCPACPRRTPSSRCCWARPAPPCTRPARRSAATSTC